MSVGDPARGVCMMIASNLYHMCRCVWVGIRYKKSFSYFECVEMARKLVLARLCGGMSSACV